MKNPAETWYYRGKEARGRGRPRELPDGRISAANRAAWGRGWDDEDRLHAPQLTVEQAREFNSFFRNLAKELRVNIPPITISSVEDEMITFKRGEHYITTLRAECPEQALAFHAAHKDTSCEELAEWRAILSTFKSRWRPTERQ